MEEQLSELTTYANALWVLVSAALVFFMHAGFALVESGFCRRKNAVMVLMKNFGVVGISSLVFYLVGYGVMFGEGNAFMGLASFFPDNGGADADLPPYVFLFFQLVSQCLFKILQGYLSPYPEQIKCKDSEEANELHRYPQRKDGREGNE